MTEARQAVDKLLDQYEQYKLLSDEIAKVDRKLALAKLKKHPTNQLVSSRELLESRRQNLSDEMTFDTPLIWALYKFEAYQDEPQPILNMHDFRLHCSKPGYICTKRFNFLNLWLESTGADLLSDDLVYRDDLSLSHIFGLLEELGNDQKLIADWRKHEYFKQDGRVKKWYNFS